MTTYATKPLVLAVLATAIAGCATNTGTVMGSVVEGRNNRPIVDAQVVMTPVNGKKSKTTRVNYGGNFTVDLPAGEYKVDVKHPELKICESGPGLVTVRAGEIIRPLVCTESVEVTDTPAPEAAPAPVTAPGSAPPATAAPTPAPTTPEQKSSQSSRLENVASQTSNLSGNSTQFPPAPAPAFAPAPVINVQSLK